VTFEPKDKVQQIKFIILLPGGGPELQAEDDRQAFEAAAAVGSPNQVNYLNVSIPGKCYYSHTSSGQNSSK